MAIALMMEAARTSETLVNFYQTTRRYKIRDSTVSTVTRPRAKRPVFDSRQGQIFFPWPPRSERLLGQPSLLPTGCRGLFRPEVKRGRCVKMTTHLHLVSRSRIRGVTPPLRHMFYGVIIKNQGQFYLHLFPLTSEKCVII
jgi:hypothetical protein